MTCLHCQQPIEDKAEQAPKCLRIRSSGYIVWKRMHDFCVDLYLLKKPGFQLIMGEPADRLLKQAAEDEARRKAKREGIPNVKIERVRKPLRLGDWLRSKTLQEKAARR